MSLEQVETDIEEIEFALDHKTWPASIAGFYKKLHTELMKTGFDRDEALKLMPLMSLRMGIGGD